MDTFLMKMSEEEDPDVQDKVWMNEVRELSYDMEDCIDDFMQSLDDNDTKADSFIDKIKHLLRNMKSRRRIGNEIHDLKKQITMVGERNQRYKTEVGKRNARYKTAEAFSETINGTIDNRALVIFDHVSKIVGTDESKTDVINLLTKEDGRGSTRQLRIVSIIGPGGIGKTTLANQVYRELRRGFTCQAFLSVSRSPNIMNIMRTIFSKVSGRPYAGTEEGSTQQLAINIYEFLEDKRYVLTISICFFGFPKIQTLSFFVETQSNFRHRICARCSPQQPATRPITFFCVVECLTYTSCFFVQLKVACNTCTGYILYCFFNESV
jgi:disease resistance protein RPM1